jgi:hypothetical protein
MDQIAGHAGRVVFDLPADDYTSKFMVAKNDGHIAIALAPLTR